MYKQTMLTLLPLLLLCSPFVNGLQSVRINGVKVPSTKGGFITGGRNIKSTFTVAQKPQLVLQQQEQRIMAVPRQQPSLRRQEQQRALIAANNSRRQRFRNLMGRFLTKVNAYASSPVTTSSSITPEPSASYTPTLNRVARLVPLSMSLRHSNIRTGTVGSSNTNANVDFARWAELQAQRYFDKNRLADGLAIWLYKVVNETVGSTNPRKKSRYGQLDQKSTQVLQSILDRAHEHRMNMADTLVAIDVLSSVAGVNIKSMTTKFPIEKMIELIDMSMMQSENFGYKVKTETLIQLAVVTEERLTYLLSNDSLMRMTRMTRERIQGPLREFVGPTNVDIFYRVGSLAKKVDYYLQEHAWKQLGVEISAKPEDVQRRQFDNWDKRFEESMNTMMMTSQSPFNKLQ